MESNSNPGWLRRVQEQSWEPEILISGIVLFALFQMPERIDAFSDYLELNGHFMFSNGTINEALASILKVSLYWLMIGFSLHLFSRSVWTAFVGLSYVYRDGINRDRLPYHSSYLKILDREPSYNVRIQQIERFCSTLFSVSFLLFMCMVGAILYLFFVGGMAFLWFELFPPSGQGFSADLIIISIGGLYMIDFITLGGIKRIPYLNRVYYPLYRLMSVITLAPFYRGIYYGFVTNHTKWKVMIGILLFVVISITWSMGIRNERELLSTVDFKAKNDRFQSFSGHYADAFGEEPSRVVQIPSDVIEMNVLPVFIVHSSGNEEEGIKPLCDYDAKIGDDNLLPDSLKLACLKSFYVVGVDDSTYQDVPMFYRENPQTRQNGLIAWLDISYLPKGLHRLNLYYRFPPDEDRPESFLIRRAVVEFYKTSDMISGTEKTEETIGDAEMEGTQG